ncbi:S41 family peptidase [Aquimarina litoralis]|uniref:S41 family peptidase n=1 Tax=Aquimarina litoralis TaxID=584605 RepID=UPI001C58B987|nr:S41 family peptidase [Aquimarina litoralis]MBW1297406.1 hypothetical protein [Aquimarina litoralis]
MKVIKFILGILLIANCNLKIEAQYSHNKTMPVNALKEDLQIVKKNLEEVHPGLYAYYSKEQFDATFAEIASHLNKKLTPLQFYRELLPLLPLIANNHTQIKCPKSYYDAISSELLRFPFKLYHHGEKLYVHKDLSNEQLISPGLEIISINGLTSKEILDKMFSYASTDGFNKTLPSLAISTVFSKYYAYYFDTPSIFIIKYINGNNEIKTAQIKGLLAPELNKRRKNNVKYLPPDNSISFTIKEGIGYVKIPSFQPEKPRKFKNTIKKIFKTLKEKNISNLIIDVRNNGGGYGEAADEVFSYLISETVYPYKDEFALVDEIPYQEYYKKEMFFKHFKKQPLKQKGNTYHIKNISSEKIKPKNINYKGKLFVLQNAASASATGLFLGLVKSYTNAKFIGEEAGGNPTETTANDLLSMVLPNSGVRVTIPALRTVMNSTFEHNGHGVVPDFEMIPTIDDILTGKDVVLEYALKMLKNDVH